MMVLLGLIEICGQENPGKHLRSRNGHFRDL